MKKLNLKMGGIKEMLSREQMKKVVGGYPDGSDWSYSCTCSCNSGIGSQPTYTTTYPPFTPGSVSGNESACGCSTIYVATSPGYNSSTCSRNYSS